ncbi:hypothetical protein EIN_205770 [Entamoeba invadens IP1]|uniref:Uncharacterized protein n=1 Tax=Entamoeba invadens IP1 TaxID=370355 RepID=A0A0A1UD02_ENTIV|nr:hypothetical protein EIN_205770 [Entamoeba invadens IP1]ELP91620.1 hypothetical protein EIN_205770 [Entamoeba invadens IP1]|eukprot:XP_004258391.1 hypothetical protein EIN_205770 [Entamoeba invadens IP1]
MSKNFECDKMTPEPATPPIPKSESENETEISSLKKLRENSFESFELLENQLFLEDLKAQKKKREIVLRPSEKDSSPTKRISYIPFNLSSSENSEIAEVEKIDEPKVTKKSKTKLAKKSLKKSTKLKIEKIEKAEEEQSDNEEESFNNEQLEDDENRETKQPKKKVVKKRSTKKVAKCKKATKDESDSTSD